MKVCNEGNRVWLEMRDQGCWDLSTEKNKIFKDLAKCRHSLLQWGRNEGRYAEVELRTKEEEIEVDVRMYTWWMTMTNYVDGREGDEVCRNDDDLLTEVVRKDKDGQ